MSVIEAQILTRVIAPGESSLDRKVAEVILKSRFKAADKRRMNQLVEKARHGKLNSDERAEADSYERVGHFISLLKSKARQSLDSNLA